MAQKTHLGWFIPFQRSYKDYNRVIASVWIRCLEMIEPLRVKGYLSTINQPWAPMDIAIFHRVQGFWAQQLHRLLRLRGVKTIFSVVVNYYEREGNVTLVSDSQIKDCVTMTREADAVITVSQFLKTRAEQYNPNVVYIPETVNREHFCHTKSISDYAHSPLRSTCKTVHHRRSST
jgi:hypothetical protein